MIIHCSREPQEILTIKKMRFQKPSLNRLSRSIFCKNIESTAPHLPGLAGSPATCRQCATARSRIVKDYTILDVRARLPGAQQSSQLSAAGKQGAPCPSLKLASAHVLRRMTTNMNTNTEHYRTRCSVHTTSPSRVQKLPKTPCLHYRPTRLKHTPSVLRKLHGTAVHELEVWKNSSIWCQISAPPGRAVTIAAVVFSIVVPTLSLDFFVFSARSFIGPPTLLGSMTLDRQASTMSVPPKKAFGPSTSPRTMLAKAAPQIGSVDISTVASELDSLLTLVVCKNTVSAVVTSPVHTTAMETSGCANAASMTSALGNP
mmetsp:Transcript_36820/g.90587  ORF Transcript_36820/g.90587 Transcript_36820/m.90587 type:complete len:316 (+) Transcript_36820:20-967(+)